MIDEKPMIEEIGIVKKVFLKFSDAAKYIGNYFLFNKRPAKPKLIIFGVKNFLDECAEEIANLTKVNSKGLIISYDYRTRDLAGKIEAKDIDVGRDLYFIDCISYNQGKGTPPVKNIFSINKPDDFEDVFYYSVVQLERMESRTAFIALIAPNTLLKFTDSNEIGVFLRWYLDKMTQHNVPVYIFLKQTGDPVLENIIANLV